MKDKEKSKSKTLGETIEEYLKKKMTLNTQNIKDQRKFFRGFYLGETIDADLTKFWQAHREALSLTRYLKDCTSSKPIIKEWTTEREEILLSYRISAEVPKKYCEIFAPNIKAKCIDLKVISLVRQFATGSMRPSVYLYVYGIFELENKITSFYINELIKIGSIDKSFYNLIFDNYIIICEKKEMCDYTKQVIDVKGDSA